MSTEGFPDAAPEVAPDAAPDVAAPDVAMPDAVAPDVAAPDAAVPDAEPDAPAPDAAPDAPAPDAAPVAADPDAAPDAAASPEKTGVSEDEEPTAAAEAEAEATAEEKETPATSTPAKQPTQANETPAEKTPASASASAKKKTPGKKTPAKKRTPSKKKTPAKKPKPSVKYPKSYPIGTQVKKSFMDEKLGKKRPFKGTVKNYDDETKLYQVEYEDGDTEELKKKEVDAIVDVRVLEFLGCKYTRGTKVTKPFYDPDKGKERPYKGRITSYNSKKELYTVTYEDSTTEEFEEFEVTELLVGQRKKFPDSYPVGTEVKKSFVDEKSGRKRPFKGAVKNYDKATQLYKVEYANGKAEELQKEEVDEIVDVKLLEFLGCKYKRGTKVTKPFYDPDLEKERPFKGKVTGYNKRKELYTVTYEDGETEEFEEFELEEIMVKYPDSYAVGTQVKKSFMDEELGKKRPFKGTVEKHDKATKLYKVVYENGNAEELQKEEVDEIVDMKLLEFLGCKYTRGTKVNKPFFDPDLERERPYKGKVTGYNKKKELYTVTYEDGETEEFEEYEVTKFTVKYPKSYPVGTQVKKSFMDDKLGKKRPFKGTVKKHDEAAGLYKVEYEDGDVEELQKEEVDEIVDMKNLEFLGCKYTRGTKVTKSFYDPDLEKERPYKGKITSYNSRKELYTVIYEDGEAEEFEEFELEDMLVDKGNKFPVNAMLKKEFYDRRTRGMRPFTGKVEEYDAKSKLYQVVYEDGDKEELSEEELEGLVVKKEDGKVEKIRKGWKPAEVKVKKHHKFGTYDSDEDSDFEMGGKRKRKKKKEEEPTIPEVTPKGGKRSRLELLSPSGRTPRSSRKVVKYADESDAKIFKVDPDDFVEEKKKPMPKKKRKKKTPQKSKSPGKKTPQKSKSPGKKTPQKSKSSAKKTPQKSKSSAKKTPQKSKSSEKKKTPQKSKSSEKKTPQKSKSSEKKTPQKAKTSEKKTPQKSAASAKKKPAGKQTPAKKAKTPAKHKTPNKQSAKKNPAAKAKKSPAAK